MPSIQKIIDAEITKLINSDYDNVEDFQKKILEVLNDLKEHDLPNYRIWTLCFSRNLHHWLKSQGIPMPLESKIISILLINYNFYLTEEHAEKVKFAVNEFCQKEQGPNTVATSIFYVFRLYGAFLVDEHAYPLIREIAQQVGINSTHLNYLIVANKSKFFGNLSVNLFDSNPSAIEELKAVLLDLVVLPDSKQYLSKLSRLRFANEGFNRRFNELLTSYR